MMKKSDRKICRIFFGEFRNLKEDLILKNRARPKE